MSDTKDYYAYIAKLNKEQEAKTGQKNPRAPRSKEERALQIASHEYFKAALPDLLAFHVSNEMFMGGEEGSPERQRAIISMSLLKKQGFLPGIPDWLMFWQEEIEVAERRVRYWKQRHAAIELKIGNGQLSDSQVKFRDRWLATGGLHAVCRTLAEIEVVVKGWGLKPLYPAPRHNFRAGKSMRQAAMFEFQKPL